MNTQAFLTKELVNLPYSTMRQ